MLRIAGEAEGYRHRVPKAIRIQTDRISADLAAQRLQQEGVPAQVVSDSDMLGIAGTPMAFSLIVPADREQRARAILAEIAPDERRRR